MNWKPAKDAPHEHWPMVIAARITCLCGFGGIVVLSAARKNGEWIIQDFEHSFEITDFIALKKPPHQGLN